MGGRKRCSRVTGGTNETGVKMAVEVGMVPPDFTLKDRAGVEYQLSAYKGKQPVVVAFYVLAFTGG